MLIDQEIVKRTVNISLILEQRKRRMRKTRKWLEAQLVATRLTRSALTTFFMDEQDLAVLIKLLDKDVETGEVILINFLFCSYYNPSYVTETT